MKTFPEIGLDLFAIFEDQKVMMTIFTDDKVMVHVLHSYVEDSYPHLDRLLEVLTPEDMHRFKELFWEEVIAFSAPPVRELLREMWKMVREELKSPANLLKNSSSDLLEDAPA